MRKSFTFWFLALCLVLCLGGIYLALYYQPSIGMTAADAVPERLSEGANAGSAAKTPEMPAWLLVLLAAFFAVQIVPVLIAAGKARKQLPTAVELTEINFLCETPMYLGLLGSLLGVCLTQFLTGSLAAPLAYLTTIVGILLYLFGKYTIALPLGYDVERRVLSGD